MSDPKAQLQDILWNGLQVDIYKAEEAISLFRKIGEHASAINAAKSGFDGLFGSIQSTYVSKAVLAINRLFETPKKGYSIRSVVSALKVLSKHSKVLTLFDKHFVVERLQTFGHPTGTLTSLKVDPSVKTDFIRI